MKKCAREGSNAMSLLSFLLRPGTLSARASMSLREFSMLFIRLRSNCFTISTVERTAVELSCFLSLSISVILILVPKSLLILSIATCATDSSISGMMRLPPIITILSRGFPVNCDTKVFSFS